MFYRIIDGVREGLSVVPMRYGIMWTGYTTSVLVSIYVKDGTVSIVHGGVEIGQGINTKVYTSNSESIDILCYYILTGSSDSRSYVRD